MPNPNTSLSEKLTAGRGIATPSCVTVPVTAKNFPVITGIDSELPSSSTRNAPGPPAPPEPGYQFRANPDMNEVVDGEFPLRVILAAAPIAMPRQIMQKPAPLLAPAPPAVIPNAPRTTRPPGPPAVPLRSVGRPCNVDPETTKDRSGKAAFSPRVRCALMVSAA